MIHTVSRLSRRLVAAVGAVALAVGLAGAANASVRPALTGNGGIGSLEINPNANSGLFLNYFGTNPNGYVDVDTPATSWALVYQGCGTWGTGALAQTGCSYEIDSGGLCLGDKVDQDFPTFMTCGADGTSWVFVNNGSGGYLIYDRYGLNQRGSSEFADVLGDVSYPSSAQDALIIFSPSELDAAGGTGPYSITWQPSFSLGF